MIKKLAFALSLTLVTLALAVPARAQLIGLPPDANTGNCFPFGCFLGMPSTRYQQVYHASNFALPYTITDISFFNTQFLNGGFLNSGTYTFSLSTTPRHVTGPDGLTGPWAGMETNLGADNTLFGVFVLTGQAATPVLNFTSTTGGFNYDPNLGNLLLDIQIDGIAHSGTQAFLDARNGTATPTMFSRMTDFGFEYQNWGLVTEFQGGSSSLVIGVVPEPGTVFLLATGLVGLGMAARRRQKELST